MSGAYDVLLVDHASEIGGAELSMETLVTHMDTARCRYTVVLPSPGPMAERLAVRGIAVHIVPLQSWRFWVDRPTLYLKWLLTLPLQWISLVRWLRFLQALRPDIVHFNINRLVEPVLAAWLLHIPSVMHFRDIPSRMRLRFVLNWHGFYAVMNLADQWIANSQATRDDIASHAHCPLSVIPNAIDLADFDRSLVRDSEAARKLLSSNQHHVAMIGLLNPWKNQADFVRLAIKVSRQRQDTTFYLVGADNMGYGAELRGMVVEAGAQDQVRFLGHVAHIPALLSQLDLVAHTMPYESFGRVFIEAMAARKPVVAFNSGGAAEIVIDDETGVLCPPGDLEAMAQALCALLENPERRRQMGEAGRRLVEQKYTARQHARMVLEVYDEFKCWGDQGGTI